MPHLSDGQLHHLASVSKTTLTTRVQTRVVLETLANIWFGSDIGVLFGNAVHIVAERIGYDLSEKSLFNLTALLLVHIAMLREL